MSKLNYDGAYSMNRLAERRNRIPVFKTRTPAIWKLLNGDFYVEKYLRWMTEKNVCRFTFVEDDVAADLTPTQLRRHYLGEKKEKVNYDGQRIRTFNE